MIEDLYQVYEMHNDEMQQVMENVEIYLQKSKKVFDKICKNGLALQNRSPIALVAYDKFFTAVSNMLDVARKFNFHLFINDMDKKPMRGFVDALDACEKNGKVTVQADKRHLTNMEPGKTISDKSHAISTNSIQKGECKEIERQKENGYDYKTLSTLPTEENGLESADSKILTCLKKDITKYNVGSRFKASVTYLQDLENLNFFACDSECNEFKKIANLKSMVHLRQYTALPPENEVFGLVLDDTILRAIREKSFDLTTRPDGKYNVLLLDFGEISVMSATDVTYRLPADIQNIPAQAILCKLRGIHGKRDIPLEELQERLQNLEYKQATFLITSKNENECTLVLELVVDTYKDDTQLKVGPENSSSKTAEGPEKVANTNPFLNDTSFRSDYNDEAVPLHALPANSIFNKDENKLPNGLTQEEMDMLAEEPLSTSNAMTAVMGYNPKDDLRLCRFYDPKIGGCFKGTNCRFEHSPAQPEGWTKDRLPTGTIVDSYFPITRYTAGIIINITPTHVGKIEYLYAQINDPDNPMEPLIWNDDDIPFHMRLTKPPMLYDLVRAQYEDNLWYRAKIINFDDSGRVFRVFYVDYGNTQNVLLKNLAYCDRSTERMPFQAVLCRLADIMKNPEATPEQQEHGIRTLNALILNHSIDVKVVNHEEDLIVRLMGSQYSQIPKRLIAMGCAKQFHSNRSKSTSESNTEFTKKCS
ncbi:uncharacterized protein krimp [Eurosta solidaginis]|uniref:uncharacterized protein krimp n=1 Tax=Eurosta solidaginis TaxID=178769 RepID=UPI0035306FD3